MSTAASRGQWTSRFGFILAAAGSAIGLGNIWRFPYTAGQNGGGAFVLVYLIFVALIGIPVLLSELSVGRRTEKNAVGAYQVLAPKTAWPWLGGLGVLSGFGILSFYSVVAGWTLGYCYYAVAGKFAGDLDSAASGEIFGSLVGHDVWPVVLCGIFMLATALVVRGGVSGGIERAARVLMPIFLVLLVLLALRALTLSGAREGLVFFLHVDFSALLENPGVIGSALGQALFSLSLGMGAMITYGSYLRKEENVPVSAASIAIFDTSIALLAGLIIFPALGHAGFDFESGTPGAGLVFQAMPTIFGEMPLGSVFGTVFYVLLAIAALTSTISLLEVIVAYFVDNRGWSREKASWVIAFVCFVLAVPSALSLGANNFLSGLPGGGFLGLMDLLFGKYGLTIGAMGICIFVGWYWGVPKALEEIEASGHKLPASPLWGFLVRWVCPVAVLFIFGLVVAGRANW